MLGAYENTILKKIGGRLHTNFAKGYGYINFKKANYAELFNLVTGEHVTKSDRLSFKFALGYEDYNYKVETEIAVALRYVAKFI